METSEDELSYQKPAKKNNEYTDFLQELYRFDKDKKSEKIKRDTVNLQESTEELRFSKPTVDDIDYKEFLQFLYRHDTEKVKRDTSDGKYNDFLSHLYRNDRFKDPQAVPDFPKANPQQVVIPKPRKVDQRYSDFLGNLYKNDQQKSRSKREIVEYQLMDGF